MRYAIVSDLHANLRAWNAVLADLCEQGADVVVCLGDVVGYGPNPAEVLNAVRSVTTNFVMGNHDAAAVGMMDYSIFNDHARQAIEWTMTALSDEEKQFLASVPLAIEAGEVLFVHAEVCEPGRFDYISDPSIAKENFEASKHFVTFVGHTHLPKIFERSARGKVRELPDDNTTLDPDKRYLVNVGSVGEPRNPDDLRARYVLYDSETRAVAFRRVEFDIAAYRNDLEATTLALRPFFLRVYEQVVEGREVAVSPSGGFTDMRVSHDSKALVDLGEVSSVADLCSSNELLKSARSSRAPTVILAVAAVLALGLLGIWLLPPRKSQDPTPPTVEAGERPETKAQETAPTPPPEQEMARRVQPEPEKRIAAAPEPKLKPKPKPKPASQPPGPKPKPTPKPQPVPVESNEPVELAWWRMGDDDESGALIDTQAKVTLAPVKIGMTIDALAPDPIPSNQISNASAKQLGIWQEKASDDHFAITAQHSFTFEGWFYIGSFRKPVFLFGTRSDLEDGRGWHLDLRPRGRGQRGEAISFFYDSGKEQSQALATDLSLTDAAHHFAIVWDHDDAPQTGEMRVFLDGTQVATAKLPHAQLIGEQIHPLRLGADFNPSRLGLDELRFTREALAPHEFLLRAPVTGVTMVKSDGRMTDSWNIPENWEGGKVPEGGDNAIIGPGLNAQIKNAPPESFSGQLVLKRGARLQLWTAESEAILSKNNDRARLIMFASSNLILRSRGESKVGPIELVEDANIHGGISTSGHHATRRFISEISGPGQLILNGVNGNIFRLEAANTHSGGTLIKTNASQRFHLVCAADQAFGKGRVVVRDSASLRIKTGVEDAIADHTGLILLGPKGNLTHKLILESDEQVARFVIDEVDQGEGVFSAKTHPKIIGGDGKLTVVSRP